MGECTLIVLDELMTLLVQRLNEWIMPWLLAWYNESHEFFVELNWRLSDVYRCSSIDKGCRY